MESHSLRVLEFDKIRHLLAEHAACSLGRERAVALVPVTDLEHIRRTLAETSEAREILLSHGSMPLGGVTDIRELVRKAEIESMLQPLELLDIAQTLGAGRRLRSFLLKQKDNAPILAGFAGRISVFEKLEEHITHSISAGGDILDSASLSLGRVRSDMKTTHSRIMERLNSMIQSSKYRTAVQDPVITQRHDRYCLPVKVEYRSVIRGIVHDASASGATLFVEPEQVIDLGNDMKRFVAKEREEIEKILRALTAEVTVIAADALLSVDAIAHIDFVTAKAGLSLKMDANEPLLNKDRWIRLVAARHPLLTGDVVPIDVELGRKFTSLLITGPNTGGKTVTLKTMGLLTLMAQSGLHVPAAPGTEIAVFDQVFADIGDEQSIEQSLSTFSSHVRNIVRVLKTVHPNSLILFDELGAGTDPAEGAALAKAVLEFLMAAGSRIVATSHYGELKEYAFTRDKVENASVEFDLETLRPTYRLMIGVPGSSNALSIAARLGMPEDVIRHARVSLSGREDGSDEIIRRIEESHKAAMDDQREARQAAIEADQLRKRYEEQVRKLEHARENLEDEVRGRGKQLIERYTRRLDRAMEELAKTTAAGKRSERLKHETKETLQKIREDLVEITEPVEELPVEGVVFKKGDAVRIANLNQEGVLLSDIHDGEATVVIGAMRVNVKASSLRPAQGGKKEERSPERTSGTSITLTKAANVSMELNLIAQRAEGALYNLEKYLDEAQAAGLKEVRIIHGKGTGALKAAVWSFIRDYPAVESYRIGNPDEGGAGATVITIRL